MIIILSEPKFTNQMIRKLSDEELKNEISKYLEDASEFMKNMTDTESILGDIAFASKYKRSRQYVVDVIGDDVLNDIYKEDSKLHRVAKHIQLVLLSDSFRVPQHKTFVIRDISDTKDRVIIKPNFAYEQIIHHILIRMILPNLRKGMYQYTCASISGRGIHYALKDTRKIISNDPKNTKYVLKMDIRKFFDSIPHRILKKKLKKVIKDKEMRSLLFRVIDSTEKGLPLGFYTSQWLANYYLQELDHYIKERILEDCGCNVKRTGRHGAVHYIRYMDDMVIFGPNKKELHKMRKRIAEYLDKELGLELKCDWQVFKFDYMDKKDGKRKGRPLDFIGYKFYRDKITIRKRTFVKMKKLIKHMVKVGVENVTFHDASAMLSYYGILTWSNSMGIYTKMLKPYITLNELKDIVRKEQKRRRDIAGIKKKK